MMNKRLKISNEHNYDFVSFIEDNKSMNRNRNRNIQRNRKSKIKISKYRIEIIQSNSCT